MRARLKQILLARECLHRPLFYSVVFAFIILGILDAGHKKVVSIARIVLMWGMSVYLLYTHAGDVVHVFATVGHKINMVQQQSMDKGVKPRKRSKPLMY